MAKGRLLREGLTFAAYLAAAIALTYPLAANFSTHVPGTGVDELAFVWNIWWFKHAIFDLGVDPFNATTIFYPLGVSFVFHTVAVFNDILALPIAAIGGIVVASNTVLLVTLALSGYGAFCLVRDQLDEGGLGPPGSGGRFAAAFAGGLAYAFPASRFIYLSLGHYNVASAEWVPFFTLFLLRMLRGIRAEKLGGAAQHSPARNALLAGVCLFLAVLNEMTFGLLMFFVAVLILLFTPRFVVLSREFARSAAILVAAAVVPYLPMVFFTVRDVAAGGGLNFPGWGYADVLSADLVGLLTPTWLHPLWAAAGAANRATFTDVNTVFIGYATPLLAIAAVVVFRRRLAMWAMGAVSFLVLSLGPVLHVNGQYLFDLDGLTVTVPLPFALFHYLPVLSMNRAPNRFSVPLSLCFAVLIAFAIAWVLSRLRGRVLQGTVAGVLAAAVVLDGLSVPLPLSDARVPAVYEQIARDPGDYAILPIPLGWRESFGTLGAEQTAIQYYQVVHGKRLINGNVARIAPFKFRYFERIGLVSSIVDEEMYRPVDAARRQRDRDAAAEVLYFFDIRYVVTHPATPGRLPYADTITQTLDYVRQVLPLEPAFAQDGVTAYRVIQPAPKPEIRVDIGTDAAQLYQGEGWAAGETAPDGRNFAWASARRAQAFVPLRLPGSYRLRFAAQPFAYPGAPAQEVTVVVNGRRLGPSLPLPAAWSEQEIVVPADAIRAGINEIWLEFAYAASPRDVLPGDRAIGTTGASYPGEIAIVADPGTCSIRLGAPAGEREAAAGGPGFVLGLLDERGQVTSVRTFNVVSDPAQDEPLAAFVAGLRQGQQVAICGRGLAAGGLSARVEQALAELGLTGHVTTSLVAAVGVKGASAGTARQQTGESQAVVRLGPNSDQRTLAVAFDWLTMSLVVP